MFEDSQMDCESAPMADESNSLSKPNDMTQISSGLHETAHEGAEEEKQTDDECVKPGPHDSNPAGIVPPASAEGSAQLRRGMAQEKLPSRDLSEGVGATPKTGESHAPTVDSSQVQNSEQEIQSPGQAVEVSEGEEEDSKARGTLKDGLVVLVVRLMKEQYICMPFSSFYMLL